MIRYNSLIFFSENGPNVCRTPEEIYESSSKLITFIDLAGHQKFMRTTVFGLMGHSPHLAFMVVSAVAGLAGTTREHLGLALALNLPIAIIVNKTDLTSPETIKAVLSQLESLLKSPACKKVRFFFKTSTHLLLIFINFIGSSSNSK